jgi:large exoprotein involved in heme utilization and adhesion
MCRKLLLDKSFSASNRTISISAFSQARPDLDVGSVSVQTPDVDPSRGLVRLPTLQDTSDLIASACRTDKGNSFAITGRGGLPEDPRQPLMSDGIWLDDRAFAQTFNPQPMPTNPSSSEAIVEAQGWTRDRNGTITLVATRSGGHTPAFQAFLCALLTGNR